MGCQVGHIKGLGWNTKLWWYVFLIVWKRVGKESGEDGRWDGRDEDKLWTCEGNKM